MASGDIINLIQNRRSIRRYAKDVLANGRLERILEAGRWAPSGLNNQPWRFLIVKDREEKVHLAKFTKYGSIIQQAPVVLLVCMDCTASYNRDKDLMAIGACIQNMLLEAHVLGIGTCWLGEILNQNKHFNVSF
ncbi:MAG: nitroreductase family protein [Candidatus Omnitrophota bacterium]